MKFILSTLLTAALAFIAGIWLPWWSIAIVALAVAILLRLSPGYGFLAGFLGIFLCWALTASWIDVQNDGILSSKVSQLLPLGGSRLLLILVTGLVGGLIGGFAALTGSAVWPRPAKR